MKWRVKWNRQCDQKRRMENVKEWTVFFSSFFFCFTQIYSRHFSYWRMVRARARTICTRRTAYSYVCVLWYVRGFISFYLKIWRETLWVHSVRCYVISMRLTVTYYLIHIYTNRMVLAGENDIIIHWGKLEDTIFCFFWKMFRIYMISLDVQLTQTNVWNFGCNFFSVWHFFSLLRFISELQVQLNGTYRRTCWWMHYPKEWE